MSSSYALAALCKFIHILFSGGGRVWEEKNRAAAACIAAAQQLVAGLLLFILWIISGPRSASGWSRQRRVQRARARREKLSLGRVLHTPTKPGRAPAVVSVGAHARVARGAAATVQGGGAWRLRIVSTRFGLTYGYVSFRRTSCRATLVVTAAQREWGPLTAAAKFYAGLPS